MQKQITDVTMPNAVNIYVNTYIFINVEYIYREIDYSTNYELPARVLPYLLQCGMSLLQSEKIYLKFLFLSEKYPSV